MQPYNHAGGPTIDVSVERRLRRLDRCLFVTWSPWALDPLTGRPIETKGAIDPVTGDVVPAGTIESPEYHLWRRDENSSKVFWVSSYRHFGHAQVAKLEGDLARFMSPSAMLQKMMEARDRVLRKGREDYEDYHNQLSKANESRIHDLVFAGKSGRRTRKVVSYPGQTNRGTPTEEFLADPEEDGWEGIKPR